MKMLAPLLPPRGPSNRSLQPFSPFGFPFQSAVIEYSDRTDMTLMFTCAFDCDAEHLDGDLGLFGIVMNRL